MLLIVDKDFDCLYNLLIINRVYKQEKSGLC